MAESTAFVRVSLPAMESRLAFHPWSLFSTLSKMKSKSWEDEFLCWMGNPRYYPKLGVDLKPRILQNESRVSSPTFGKKKTFDLVLFTFWPERSQKVSNLSRMLWQFFISTLAKSTKSSAKKRCENDGLLWEDLSRSQSFEEHWLAIKNPRIYMHKMKR